MGSQENIHNLSLISGLVTPQNILSSMERVVVNGEHFSGHSSPDEVFLNVCYAIRRRGKGQLTG
jgi:hypothetical protein